jgi:hypothetical protein
MLLGLLQHHQDIFLAAIEPLIGARNVADLVALADTCRQLRDFLARRVPFYAHFWRMRNCLKDIKSINILMNARSIIREYNGKLQLATYWHYNLAANPAVSCVEPLSFGMLNTHTLCWTSINENLQKVTITCDSGDKRPIGIIGVIPQWLYKYSNGMYITQYYDHGYDYSDWRWVFKIE